ncbi:hypothetical protein MBT42_17795 [Streptomyces sp. MBT42]|uniref:hypothetical protein n=1 Tax=Streptomyces sp. MBT42 TaxID=1488373 RepID=UPI001E4F593A|nr:hypothetical protein [Streptomyces sp. MBT42]MCD2465412.1 hypothetical protein [Streptomyces sp. MBT42]
MSWDDIALLILAAAGCTTLLLSQAGELLSRLPALIRAWHEVRRAWRDHPETPRPDEGSEEVSPPLRRVADDQRG